MEERDMEKEIENEEVDLIDTIRPIQRGMILKGTVVQVSEEGAMVDVGAKTEGLLPASEISLKGKVSPKEALTVGEEVNVFVVKADMEESNIILSKRKADFELTWQRLENSYRKGEILSAMVIDRVKGGLLVDLGIQGFVPASQVDLSQFKRKRLEHLIGETIPLKIIEINKSKGKLVLSHKTAAEEINTRKKEEIFSRITPGQVVTGVVSRLTDFGAFVDLGGIDGLLHISDISWSYIKHPREVLKRQQKIEVLVLKVDKENERISLGLKQLLPDPWQEAASKYKKGDVVQGKVVRVVPTGAFVRLSEGIDAFIPLREVGEGKGKKAEEVFSKGQRIQAMIIDIQDKERRMILSLRQLKRQAAREKTEKYLQQQKRPTTTIGDLAGDILEQLKEASKEGE